MDRMQLLSKVKRILEKSGFELSELCSFKNVGFDLIARRGRELLIVKVLVNVDAFSDSVANDLKALASLLRASLLLIGEREGSKPLENDVIYFRNGVQTVNVKTLENYLLENVPPQVYAAPGGFYVNLDGEKIRKYREKKKLSRGDLARMLHVSRKTIRLYEEGMSARVEVAALLGEILHPSVISSFDLLKPVAPFKGHRKISETRWLYTFQKEILSLIERLGYKVIPIHRCPFEAISKESKNILLTVAQKYSVSLREKARMVRSIAEIAEKHAVIFIDKCVDGKRNIEGMPMIEKRELRQMKDPSEVMELVIEREG